MEPVTRKKMTMDGNHAAAYVAYAYTDVAAIYPITPSSVMAEQMEVWAAEGKENLFEHPVEISQMQSEAGAAAAVHGALSAGALATTFTASQGLLLMIPNLYKIAGERLPGVFHVAARTVATHALSIFGDHSDVYACRQTGAVMLCASSVQEVMDFAPAAHAVAVEGRLPVIHFFDGFRTSHEVQKIEVWSREELRDLFPKEAAEKFRKETFSPEHPFQMGQAQNPDIFFQVRETVNDAYQKIPQITEKYLHKVSERTGRSYELFEYYGAEDATRVLVAMGSVCETAEETIDGLLAKGEKAGIIKVRLYRPFSREHFLEKIPPQTENIYVLDRTKEPGAPGEPLYLDVTAALSGSAYANIPVYHGRYGISSKDTTPGQLAAVFHHTGQKEFTIGIRDDVTGLSLEPEALELHQKEIYSCKFWGLGADGTVGANKNTIRIIGDHTDLSVQAYFEYDSKKSGGLTISHLRFGKGKIRSAYRIGQADFVACHNPSYIRRYPMAEQIRPGGIFLLNCPWTPEETGDHLPGQMKRYLAENKIRFYVVDGVKLAIETGMGPTRINTVLQAAFFAVTEILPKAEVTELLKDAARQTYAKKGEDVVSKNCAAIDAGMYGVRQVIIPEDWKNCQDEDRALGMVQDDRQQVCAYVNHIQHPVNGCLGDLLPVSAFLPYTDGRTPSGTAAFEKRGIAVRVPDWKPENCITCNICSLVCPHSVIRPVAMTPEEKERAPHGMKTVPLSGTDGYAFSIAVSVFDCTGCGICAACCPAKEKALVMEPFEKHQDRQKYFTFAKSLPVKKDLVEKFGRARVRGSQFLQPLLEFHGACAGCGETPYAKLVTQLFGERMYIANATGCSSIWGNSSPATPYTVNADGKGPAWSNSLFEDAAEFGYGMFLCEDTMRKNLKKTVEKLMEATKTESLKQAAGEWLATYEDGSASEAASDRLVGELLECECPLSDEILAKKQFLSKKSVWIFGGDGWAYDIGFGGLDHVLASGKDINILVFDTEVYSNTGGQASKATPRGAVAQFAAAGRKNRKKDLAAMAMSYKNVYVAQVAMGADYGQCIRAVTEAEAYPGPSLILAYSPCINHGIRSGMICAQEEEKMAVASGHYHLFRYQPPAGGRESACFFLDSREPSEPLEKFYEREVRFAVVNREESVFRKAEEDAKDRYLQLKNFTRNVDNATIMGQKAEP